MFFCWFNFPLLTNISYLHKNIIYVLFRIYLFMGIIQIDKYTSPVNIQWRKNKVEIPNCLSLFNILTIFPEMDEQKTPQNTCLPILLLFGNSENSTNFNTQVSSHSIAYIWFKYTYILSPTQNKNFIEKYQKYPHTMFR